MTFNNLCDSCTNIGCEFQSGIVRTECAFYMPPQLEPDNCGNYIVMQQIVEAIQKDQYETRLKADMVAMLEELEKELKEVKCNYLATIHVDIAEEYFNLAKVEGLYLIRQKISKLKGDEE